MSETLPGERAVRAAPRRWCAIACILLTSPALRAQDATFEMTLGPAVLCRADLDPAYFHAYLTAIKKSYKREQGAYWFKVSAQLYGAPVTEAFVSDGSSDHVFIGVVSSLPPPQLAESLSEARADSFKPLVPADKHSAYRSAKGAQIVYQARNAKLFCRGDRPAH